ncbi:IS3 family transposase ISEc27 (plasmid) [Providencia manganoxydans]
MTAKKADCARALITQGWKISLVSRTLRVSRAQLYVLVKRKSDCKDGRGRYPQGDNDALARIHNVIDKLPMYGYRRVWAILRRQSENEGIAIINAKRVYRIMKQSALLLERKPEIPVSTRAHTGKVSVSESNQRWCSDGFEFRCDNGRETARYVRFRLF